MNLNNTFDSINCFNGINVFTRHYLRTRDIFCLLVNIKLYDVCVTLFKPFSSGQDVGKFITSTSEKKFNGYQTHNMTCNVQVL